MKTLILVTSVVLPCFLGAQSMAEAPKAGLSAAEQRIAEARRSINEKPAQYQGYNLLAAALVRRARETSDPSFYTQAVDAVKKSLELAPHNFETERIRVSILLG